MLVSIMHRVMGVAMATAGVAMFTWWLVALASGKDAYAAFLGWASWPPMLIVPIGLSFAFFMHMGNGIRHFVLDIGAGYELKINKTGAIAVIVAAVVLTVVMWLYVLARTV